MRSSRFLLCGFMAALLTALLAPAAMAAGSWGPESPPFNVEVVLHDVTGGPGFGLVRFRQPNDDEKVIYLDTWVRSLAAHHEYLLQRAVDPTLDGSCPGTGWLTLGQGLAQRSITTDARGTGREALFRSVPMLAVGAAFDIEFRVVDAATGLPVLASDCYRFTVSM